MRLDFSQPILDLQGKPLIENLTLESLQRAMARLPVEIAQQVVQALREEGAAPVTVADVASGALIAGFEDERNLPLDEKVRRMNLALRICNGGEVELTTDEAVKIKHCVNRRFPGVLKPARVAELIEAQAS